MKNIFFFILCCFYFCTVINGQSNCDQDSTKFLIAYNYIINDSINQGKDLIISNSLVSLNVAVFFRELKQKDEDEYSLAKRLYGIYQNVDFGSKLTFLNDKSVKYSKNILFFSPIINDSILCAELFEYRSNLNKNNENEYMRIAAFSTSYIYLFVFDKVGKIKSMFRKEMIND
ncbi:MAG: hypothetical protein ACLS4S_02155 [Bacteroides nordii]